VVAPKLLIAVAGGVLAAAGCGRLDFDAMAGGDADPVLADAAVATCPGVPGVVPDEDGDLVGNPCDVCPHRADPDQADGDGDHVGDACDPQPTLSLQRIVFFDGFDDASVAGWVSPPVVVDGHMVIDGTLGAYLMVPTGDTVLELAGDIVTVGAAARQQLVVGTEASPTLFYYTELIDEGLGRRRSLMRNDQGMYTEFQGQLDPGIPITPGPLHVRFETRPDGFGATIDYAGSGPVQSISGLGQIAGSSTTLFTQDLTIHLAYVIQIETIGTL